MLGYLDEILKRFKDILNPSSDLDLTEETINNFFRIDIIWLLQKAILSGEYFELDGEKINQIIESIQKMEMDLDFYEFEKLLYDDDFVKESLLSKQIGWVQKIEDIGATKLNIGRVTKQYLDQYHKLIVYVFRNIRNLSDGKAAVRYDTKPLLGYGLIKDFSEVLLRGVEEPVSEDIYNYYVFKVTLLLAFIDEGLHCSQSMVDDLENLIAFLSELKFNKFSEEVIPVLQNKAEFLLYKINYRYCLKSSKASLDSDDFIVNKDEEPSLSDENIFSKFSGIIRTHYSSISDSVIKEYEKIIEEFKGKRIDEIRLEPFHYLSKAYRRIRDIETAERKERVDALLNILKSDIASLSRLTDFNAIAYKSTFKYLENSSLRLELKCQSEKKYSDIIPELQTFITDKSKTLPLAYLEKTKKRVENLAKEFGIQDFNSYWIFISFLNELIEYILKNPNVLIDSSVFKEVDQMEKANVTIRIDEIIFYLRKIYTSLLSKLYPALQNMISHASKPVYMYRRECEVDFEWNDIEDQKEDGDKGTSRGVKEGPIFLDSSYVLPNDFDRFREKVDNCRAFINPQLSHLKDALEIQVSHVFIDELVKKTEKRAKEGEFRVVTIVAMFVSIATFVLINVKIFDGKSGIESIGIMLGLASCFFLFNLFFHIMTLIHFRGKKTFKEVWAEIGWLLIFPLLFVATSLFILYKNDGKMEKMHENLQNQYDGLQNKHRADSTEWHESNRVMFDSFNHISQDLRAVKDSLKRK